MLEYYPFKKEITDILDKINIPKERFRVVPGPVHSEGYYYENRGGRYIYGYFERGTTSILCDTENYDEFKYCILRHIIKNFAIDYEVKNRVPSQDTRRIWMKKALELIKEVSDAYYIRLSDEFNKILENFPFDDEKI